jgi:hypothetical protein
MFRLIWERALDNSLGAGRDANRKAALGEVEFWCAKKANGAEILEQFHALADEPAEVAR